MNEKTANLKRLRFPGELEDIFREDYFHKSLRQLRLGIVLGAVLYAFFGVLDAQIFPETKAAAWFVRYAVVCPACVFTALFTYSRRFKKHMQLSVFFLVLVGGAGIVAMMVIVRSPINYFHFAGLLLVLMYSFTFSKLRFFYTALASWLIVGMYEAAALGIMHIPLRVFLNDNFFYISANLIGMFSSYHRELYMRKDFLQNMTVKELEEKNHIIEKEKILRDLHDGIGGIATNISLLADLAQKADSLADVKRTLTTISGLSREGLTEIRNFMRSLEATGMTWNALAAELRSQGSSMVEPHGIYFHIKTAIDVVQDQPGSFLWLNFFRIYKEALTNVIKHSGAKAVDVDLRVTYERLFLCIADDGVGMGKEAFRGRGISSMQARAHEIGGDVTVTFGSGTTVCLELPLPVRYAA